MSAPEESTTARRSVKILLVATSVDVKQAKSYTPMDETVKVCDSLSLLIALDFLFAHFVCLVIKKEERSE